MQWLQHRHFTRVSHTHTHTCKKGASAGDTPIYIRNNTYILTRILRTHTRRHTFHTYEFHTCIHTRVSHMHTHTMASTYTHLTHKFHTHTLMSYVTDLLVVDLCSHTHTHTHTRSTHTRSIHTIFTHTHTHNSYLTVIGVHKMHGRVHPNYCQITILLVVDPLSSWDYFIMTHPLHVL